MVNIFPKLLNMSIAAGWLILAVIALRLLLRKAPKWSVCLLWALVALAVCGAAAICFLTDPMRVPGDEKSGAEEGESPAEKGDPEENLQPEEKAGTEGRSQVSEEQAEEMRLTAFLQRWTDAFVARDGETIAAMVSEEAAAELAERGLLFDSAKDGAPFSSDSWPVDGREDVLVYESYDTMADIYYYAWNSAPHVTVWKERLFYEKRDGEYVVTGERLTRYDNISSFEQYQSAYLNGMIDGTRMDYQVNGEADVLESKAMLSSTTRYKGLFEPESAAVELLNLSGDSQTVSVECVWDSGDTAGIEIAFPREGRLLRINMTRLRSDGTARGVWIPQNYYVGSIFALEQVDWAAVKRQNLSVGSESRAEGVLCIGRIPEKKIAIYGNNDEWSGTGVAVEIEAERYFFEWVYTSPRGILPECCWNETAGQLQVALHIYTGTGVDAQELHVLQYRGGVLTDNALKLGDLETLLYERIRLEYDGDASRIRLLDDRDQTELADVEIAGEPVRELELGSISQYVLGEQLLLQVNTGYYVGDSYGVAEYEDMPGLEAEILMREDGQGGVRFELGEITATQPFGG